MVCGQDRLAIGAVCCKKRDHLSVGRGHHLATSLAGLDGSPVADQLIAPFLGRQPLDRNAADHDLGTAQYVVGAHRAVSWPKTVSKPSIMAFRLKRRSTRALALAPKRARS